MRPVRRIGGNFELQFQVCVARFEDPAFDRRIQEHERLRTIEIFSEYRGADRSSRLAALRKYGGKRREPRLQSFWGIGKGGECEEQQCRESHSHSNARARTSAPSRRYNQATFTKIITSVYRASDSISTRPSSSANRIAAAAPGFRAMPSAAAATALACARPHTAEAMAIEKPEVIATQFVPPPAGPCANIGLAKNNS